MNAFGNFSSLEKLSSALMDRLRNPELLKNARRNRYKQSHYVLVRKRALHTQTQNEKSCIETGGFWTPSKICDRKFNLEYVRDQEK